MMICPLTHKKAVLKNCVKTCPGPCQEMKELSKKEQEMEKAVVDLATNILREEEEARKVHKHDGGLESYED